MTVCAHCGKHPASCEAHGAPSCAECATSLALGVAAAARSVLLSGKLGPQETRTIECERPAIFKGASGFRLGPCEGLVSSPGLLITRVEIDDTTVRLTVRNTTDEPHTFCAVLAPIPLEP